MNKRILLAVNKDRDKNGEYTKRAKSAFKSHGADVTVISDFFEAGKTVPDIRDIDCICVLGGDGTIIRASGLFKGSGIPILGINIGNIGFLAGAEKDEIEYAAERLVTGDFKVENRMMLDLKVNDGENHAFLNDAVITRNGCSRMISVTLSVNGKQLNTVSGDGVIIATPTGSTGYNLSAGGMICVPEAEMTLVTPICPHSVGARGFIATASDVIEAYIPEGRYTEDTGMGVTVDGSEFIPLKAGDRVLVRRSDSTTKLVKINDSTFFDTMKKKLSL